MFSRTPSPHLAYAILSTTFFLGCSDGLLVGCPSIFRSFSVVVVDSTGRALPDLNVTVTSLLVGDTLFANQVTDEDGAFAVMDDSYRDRVVATGEIVRAVGHSDEHGFTALFRFADDKGPCHSITKTSGPETVVAKLSK